MSAYGPKRTSLVALHMSAFGGKADMCEVGKFFSETVSCRLISKHHRM
jgi:hypothetical protein